MTAGARPARASVSRLPPPVSAALQFRRIPAAANCRGVSLQRTPGSPAPPKPVAPPMIHGMSRHCSMQRRGQRLADPTHECVAVLDEPLACAFAQCAQLCIAEAQRLLDGLLQRTFVEVKGPG